MIGKMAHRKDIAPQKTDDKTDAKKTEAAAPSSSSGREEPCDKNFGSFWKCEGCGQPGYWFAPGMMNCVGGPCKDGKDGHVWVRDKS